MTLPPEPLNGSSSDPGRSPQGWRPPTDLRYALVHEWLTPLATGGSELVVQEILRHIDARVYALIDFESSNPHSYLWGRQVGTTFVQHLPGSWRGVQKYLPLLPLAIEQLDLGDYDVILSSSHTVAKGVLTTSQQMHVCYCHTPMRYAWDLTFEYLAASPLGRGLPGLLTRHLLHKLRQWDVITANRVDFFIANSQHTARRIWRCYRRPARVIYPPVQVDRFPFQPDKQDYYLTVSRLVSYKKVDLIVEAFNRLGYPLVVIGGGPELVRLKRLAGPQVRILGPQPQSVVQEYMAGARAFIYAACEDFGIAPVEAQACGTPVIAYGQGGALETILDFRHHPQQGTGLFFSPQHPLALAEAVEYARGCEFDPGVIRDHAQRFRPQRFQEEYLSHLADCWQKFSVDFLSKNYVSCWQ